MLHRNSRLSQIGDAVKIRDAAQCKHEVVVFQRMDVLVESVGYDNLMFRNINGPHFSFKEVHVSQQLPERIDDMGQIEIACRNFVKHRG